MAESAAPEIRVQAHGGLGEYDELTSSKGRSSPAAGLSFSNKLIRSLSSNPVAEVRRGPPTPGATDPITQNIMDRKSMEHSSPQLAQKTWAQIPAANLEPTDSPRAESRPRRSFDLRSEPFSSPGTASKDRKPKASSFLSRFRSNAAKKRDSVDLASIQGDDPVDAANMRSEGTEAAVFSQPMGYIPKFPEPPKYIKVRARNKEQREFDRLFLAQELRGRTGVEIAQAGGHKINVDTKMKHDNATWAVEFSKDGRFLAAGGKGHVVRVWAVIASEAERREEGDKAEEPSAGGQGVKLSAPVFKSRPVQEYEGHTASILSVSWSKNNFLLSSSMDKTVRLWHVSREECLCVFKHPDHVPAVQFHPQDDRFFLAGSLDSKLRLWSIPDKTVAYSAMVKDLITAVAFTPDGKTVIAGTLQGHCLFYDTEGLREQTKMHVRSAHGKNARGSKITGIQAITLPPNDPKGSVKLLITSNDSRVRVYNLRDKSLELKLKGYENVTSQLRATFADDARHVICGSEDKRCYIWNMCRPDKDREKHPLETFDASGEVVTCGIFAPSATKQLLQASGDPVFEICNPPPVQLLSKEETKSVRSLKSADTPKVEQHGTKTVGNGHGVQVSVEPPASPTEKPSTFKTRSAHPGGHIIITADTEGRVKCFRSDCAYKNRLKNNESWDSASTFSKKVLHRSSSIATRASRNSISLRDSIVGMGQPSERILSWRQSIDRSSLPPPASGPMDLTRSPSLRMGRSNRSASPRKSMSGLGSILQGRRTSGTPGMFMSRPEAHPLQTSVTNTPAPSSGAVSSQQSLQSASSGYGSGGETQARTLKPGDFSALGITDDGGSSANGTVRRNRRRRSMLQDTEEEEEEDCEEDEDDGAYTGGEGDSDDAAEVCQKCGGDSFKAVKLGKGKGTRLQCAKCGTNVG